MCRMAGVPPNSVSTLSIITPIRMPQQAVEER
jgi:hypothetical protein